MAFETSSLSVQNVCFAYGSREVLRDVTVSVGRGERLALAGPNGSGKTTLLRLLGGALRPAAGAVTLDGIPLGQISRRALARRVGVVAQHVEPRLTFSVRELVSMGRTPYIGMFAGQSAQDLSAVEAALAATDTAALADRRFSDLSGGEQQRVMVAVGLAQETDYLLLDEPTVHLDLQHQHELLQLLHRLNHERRIGLVAVLHDLNLASLYFERLVVLSSGRVAADGPPSDVVNRDVLQTVFRAPLQVISHPATGLPQVLLDPWPPPDPGQ
jgi:iron complex transport system ATP-binding protein